MRSLWLIEFQLLFGQNEDKDRGKELIRKLLCYVTRAEDPTKALPSSYSHSDVKVNGCETKSLLLISFGDVHY